MGRKIRPIMTKVEVEPGNCGMKAVITADSEDGQSVRLSVETSCPHVRAAIDGLGEVDGIIEATRPPGESAVYKALAAQCTHSACPVPMAVLKAVEVESGMALPQDVTVRMTRE